MKTNLRRNDLDWLRVFAILAIFVFHSGRFFDTGGWHVKNPTTYVASQEWTTFLSSWLMPLIFVISGASLFYGLGSRGVGKFIDNKVRRLLVPFIVGVFSHVILQVYLERITHHQFSGSFLDFIPHYFEGLYGFGGNFAWMGLHLWYLLILFVFSLLFYPLFHWLRDGSGKTVLKTAGDFLALPGLIYLPALPIAFVLVNLDIHTGPRHFGGWPLSIYIFFFIYGFIIVSHDDLQRSIRQLRRVSLLAGVLCWATLFMLWGKPGYPPFGTARYVEVFGIYGVSSWCWILAFLGLGFERFTQSRPILSYANEAVLPFYILHQTVLLSVGYFVTRWEIPDLLKWIIIAAISFPVVMTLYEFAIRRFNVMRFLFGMKALPPSKVISS
jgi:glucans biosynthesis protein C